MAIDAIRNLGLFQTYNWSCIFWKFKIGPNKIIHPKRKVVFQPSFFRGELLNVDGFSIYNPTSDW